MYLYHFLHNDSGNASDLRLDNEQVVLLADLTAITQLAALAEPHTLEPQMTSSSSQHEDLQAGSIGSKMAWTPA